MDKIIANAKVDPLIIVMSDHGPASNGNEAAIQMEPEERWFNERIPILKAVRIPESCDISEFDKSSNSWNTFREIRGVVNAALEIARQEKVIGSSLEASTYIYIQNEEYISVLEDKDLEELFIVSNVKLIKEKIEKDCYKEDDIKGLGVKVYKAEGKKCIRCWKIIKNYIKKDSNILCERCIEAVKDI